MPNNSGKNSRVIVVINYDKSDSLEAVECIRLDSQKDYAAAVIRIYQTLESDSVNSQKPELVIVAPPGSFSNWLNWTRPLDGVWFVDYKTFTNPQPLKIMLALPESAASAPLPLGSEVAEEQSEKPNNNSNPDKQIPEKAIIRAIKKREPIKRKVYANSFVGFLSNYNTNGANHSSAYEEYQRKAANPLDIETKTQKYLLDLFSKENLKSGKTPSVILTGNAGDGKTRLCRLVWEKLSSRDFATAGQSLEDSIIDLSEECQCKVKIIKDLSDWTEQRGVEILKQLVIGEDEAGIRTVFLIAANEGRLRWALQADTALAELRKEVEEALNSGTQKVSSHVVLNLNQISTSRYVLKLIDRMTAVEHWKECEECPAASYCPIKWNRNKLASDVNGNPSLPAERLLELYKVIEQLGRHITFRDALIHLSYTLIGRLNCYSVQTVPEEQHPHFARWVYYKNCYADEADTSFQHIGVFSQLRGFDVASISNFHIDQFILNGNLHSNARIKTSWQQVFMDGVDLGGDKKLFINALLSYLNKESNPNSKPVTNKGDLLFDLMKWWLPHCRRKYYFEWSEDLGNNFESTSPYSLIPFKSYSTMKKLLSGNNDVFLHEQVKLVTALNRIFSELFLKEEKILYVPSRTGFTTRIPVPVIRNTFLTDSLKLAREEVESVLEREPNKLVLSVITGDSGNISLHIDLLLFEYLWRVQEGGTLDYLREECGLAVTKFQETLLVIPSNLAQNQVIKVFNYVDRKFIIQNLTLTDGPKLIIS